MKQNKIKIRSDIKITFFGHRFVYDEEVLFEKLKMEIEEWIEKGAYTFYIGTHGMFDKMAMSACRLFRKQYKNIKIYAVLTSLAKLNKNRDGYAEADFYSDVETIFFSTENEYYKNQIIVNNQNMIDECDVVIGYVDMKRGNSGAKRALLYAKKKGKLVINIFDDNK